MSSLSAGAKAKSQSVQNRRHGPSRKHVVRGKGPTSGNGASQVSAAHAAMSRGKLGGCLY